MIIRTISWVVCQVLSREYIYIYICGHFYFDARNLSHLENKCREESVECSYFINLKWIKSLQYTEENLDHKLQLTLTISDFSKVVATHPTFSPVAVIVSKAVGIQLEGIRLSKQNKQKLSLGCRYSSEAKSTMLPKDQHPHWATHDRF